MDKLNYHTKRENSLYYKNKNNINIKEENKTKEKLKSMERSINQISLINNNSSFNFDNYNISKINLYKLITKLSIYYYYFNTY